ncbi:MAG: alpha/beta fold hydrolase, partial [Bacteroidota bacterium]
MKKILISLIYTSISIIACNLAGAQDYWQPSQKAATVSQPIHILEETFEFIGTENLILLPENRENPQSREIAIHFLHFPAKIADSLAPVFFLPGGPGAFFTIEDFELERGGTWAKVWTYELKSLNKYRDIIILNQRGNTNAPGLPISDFRYRYRRGFKDKAFDREAKAIRQKEAFAKALEKFQAKGIDVKGYDILNMVEDIEDVRKHFSYEKIALIGASFGSQWGLAYMKQYEHRVDRALMSSVEPLDYAYDDAAEVWKVYQKLGKLAEEDADLKTQLPDIGLVEAYKAVVKKLEEGPLQIPLDIPEAGIKDTIELGLGDLHYSPMSPIAEGRRDALASWPKYVTELYQGEFRLLALRIYQGREGYARSSVFGHLIDNSLGITAQRDQLLLSREANRWLGDPSVNYRQTRKVSPTAVVSDEFRQLAKQDIPLLMIQGDMDWNTPLANATDLLPYYPQGHLITVGKGTHSSRRELILDNPELGDLILHFMDIDLEKESLSDYYKQLPSRHELSKLNFTPIKGESLYEKLKQDLLE